MNAIDYRPHGPCAWVNSASPADASPYRCQSSQSKSTRGTHSFACGEPDGCGQHRGRFWNRKFALDLTAHFPSPPFRWGRGSGRGGKTAPAMAYDRSRHRECGPIVREPETTSCEGRHLDSPPRGPCRPRSRQTKAGELPPYAGGKDVAVDDTNVARRRHSTFNAHVQFEFAHWRVVDDVHTTCKGRKQA